MTKERQDLIDEFQKWLDSDPRKQIVAAVCANIAEDYAESAVKKLNLASVSRSVAKQYAEFCIRCDREGLQLLELDDYIKQYCC